MATRTVTVKLQATSGSVTASDSVQVSTTMAGRKVGSIMQTLSTTPAVLNLAGCSNIGDLMIRNMDAAIDVTVYSDSGATEVLSVLKPGKPCLLGYLPETPYVKSASGTPDIFIVCAEQ